MTKTIMQVLMYSGVSLFGVALVFRPREDWKWGKKHFWKVGILGIVLLFVGLAGFMVLEVFNGVE